MVSMGIGLGVVDLGVLGGGGSPPPPAYHAGAVNFSAGSISCDTLVAVENYKTFTSFWARANTWPDFSPIWQANPAGTSGSYLGLEPGGNMGQSMISQTGETITVKDTTDAGKPPTDAWIHWIFAIDLTKDDGFYHSDVYRNGVQVNTGPNGTDLTSVPLFNGLPFWLGNDQLGDQFDGDYADIFIDIGNSYLNASGALDPATVALFITGPNGKPVDPSVAVGALGQPTMLFSGNHLTLPVNQGSGGTFSVTGTLTDATTSPSD